MDYKELYEKNRDFRRYVDRYCRQESPDYVLTVDEALEHKRVRNVGDAYREAMENE